MCGNHLSWAPTEVMPDFYRDPEEIEWKADAKGEGADRWGVSWVTHTPSLSVYYSVWGSRLIWRHSFLCKKQMLDRKHTHTRLQILQRAQVIAWPGKSSMLVKMSILFQSDLQTQLNLWKFNCIFPISVKNAIRIFIGWVESANHSG